MSRMLEALKQIEAKRVSSQTQADQATVEHKESTSLPVQALLAYESDFSEVGSDASDSDLTGLHPLVLDELDALRLSMGMTEEPNASSSNVQIEISDDSCIDKTLSQAESALSLALSPDEPDIYFDMAQYVLARVTPNLPTALIFTSPSDGVGNSEMLFSLSKTLTTRFNVEMLAVDANFQHPDMTGMFRSKYSFGLEEVLCGSIAWNNAIHKTDMQRLNILPNKGGIRHTQMPYNSGEWGHLFEQLKTRYQLILIDAPSLAHAQTASMISQCDGAYLVIRLGRTTPYELRESVRVIGQAGGRLFGSIAVGAKR
jgi:Mrp family chromosome partitioning ATPase